MYKIHWIRFRLRSRLRQYHLCAFKQAETVRMCRNLMLTPSRSFLFTSLTHDIAQSFRLHSTPPRLGTARKNVFSEEGKLQIDASIRCQTTKRPKRTRLDIPYLLFVGLMKTHKHTGIQQLVSVQPFRHSHRRQIEIKLIFRFGYGRANVQQAHTSSSISIRMVSANFVPKFVRPKLNEKLSTNALQKPHIHPPYVLASFILCWTISRAEFRVRIE